MVGEEGVEEARPTLDEELAFEDEDVVDIPPKIEWVIETVNVKLRDLWNINKSTLVNRPVTLNCVLFPFPLQGILLHSQIYSFFFCTPKSF